MKKWIVYILAFVFFAVVYILFFDPCPKICILSFLPPIFFWFIFIFMYSHGNKSNPHVLSAAMKSGTLFEYEDDDEFDRTLMNKPRDDKFALMEKYLNQDFIHSPEDDQFDAYLKKLKENREKIDSTTEEK